MIRLLCMLCVAGCTLSHQSLLAQQPSGDSLTFGSVDTFLLKRDYAGARERLMTIQHAVVDLSRPSEFTPVIIRDYLGTLDRLQAIPDIADSIMKPIAENATGFTDRFSELNAGEQAHRFYGEYQSLFRESHYSIAYERFTLAEFLRHLYVIRDRERLLLNFDRAREFVKRNKFIAAETMIKNFGEERRTAALVQMKDTLAQKYETLADQLHARMVAEAYELGREPVEKTFYLSVGMGLIPGITVASKELVFFNIAGNQLNTSRVTDNAFSFATIGVSAEVGYFITPSFSAGISYFESSTLQENSLVSVGIPLRYKARFRYQMINAMVKYNFDRRTGLRPYASLSAGRVQGKLIPESYALDQFALTLGEIDEGGAQFGIELGADFVTSLQFPLCFTAFVSGRLYAGDGGKIVPGTQFLIGMKVGYLF